MVFTYHTSEKIETHNYMGVPLFLGAAFGGSSQTVFGSTGATSLLHKVTTAIAVVFMLTSLSLSFFIGKGGPSSVMEDVAPVTPPVEQTQQAPAQQQAPGPAETQEKK